MHDLDKAKQMYFSDIPVPDIASELDIPINKLGYSIFGADKTGNHPGCWYQQRKQVAPFSFTRYMKVKPYILSMAESRIADMISAGVDELSENGGVSDIDGINKAVDILSKLDKLGRLERGEATDNIVVEHGVTLRDIVNGRRLVDIETTKEDDNGEEENGEEEGYTIPTRSIAD